MRDATFSANRLLELYDSISDAEDAIPRLRRFVLDLAVRGKLVEQDASDEPAAGLLKRIAQEKARLIKAKEIKKLKLVEPISTDEGLDIPASWRQARLGELSLLITKGSTPTSYGHEYTSSGVSFVKVESIVKGVLSVATISSFISPETHDFLSRSQLVAGDILFSIAGTIGTCALVEPEMLPANTNQALAIIRGTGLCFAPDFLITTLRSRVADAIQKKARGGAMNNVSLQDIQNVVMPLPPLAEQHRIVAKVDELMALCDQLEQARAGREAVRDRVTTASLARLTAPETDAETFQSHARFALQSLPTLTTRPDQIKTLRQTILNLAVRGKLVEQVPTDEPAAELLKRIENEIATKRLEMGLRPNAQLPLVEVDDAPFDLPEGWAWARFPEVGVFARGKSKHRPRNDPNLYIDGTVPFVQTGDVARSGGLVAKHSSVYNETGLRQSLLWPAGTMCITIAANIADSGILTFDACFPDSVVGLVAASDFENARFFEYFVRTAKANLTEFAPATAQKNINLGILEMVLIPLPPLAEQHRIVAKVDALMAICDQLEASLTTTANTRSKLLNALLHEALEPIAETADA